MKLRFEDRSLLFAQLGMVLQAGFGIEQGFTLIAQDLKDEQSKALILQLNENRKTYATLHEAFAACDQFDAYTIQLIRAGEASGNLDDVMLALADYYRRMDAMSQNMRQALTYPVILLVMMEVIVGVIAWMVLPIFQDVLRSLGNDLTSSTSLFMQLGRSFSIGIFFILGIGLLGLVVFLLYTRKQKQDAASMFIERCPFTAHLRTSMWLAQLTYTLAMLLCGGMDVREALGYARDVVNEPRLKQKISACMDDMEKGSSLSDAFTKHQLYQGMQLNMLQIGFASGKEDTVMKQLSVHYEEEVDIQTKRFLNIIEPSIVLLLAIIVGVVLLSVLMPLMSILSAL